MKNIFLLLSLLFCSNSLLAQDNYDPANVKSIYFGGGSYFIDYQQVQELYDFLDGIDGIEQYSIIVHSHTDDIGDLEYNEWLSKMRSWSVIQLLKKKGIPEEVINKQDFGELNPVYDNSTMDGKLRNRRADVILLPPVS